MAWNPLITAALVDLPSVLWGRRPPAAARFHQQRLLRQRLRWLAAVGGALVLGWIAVEALALAGNALLPLVLLRLALGTSLCLLALLAPRLPPLLGLSLLVLLESLFFAALRGELDADAPSWLRLGYGLMPFALVAQLALLPLDALRSLLLSLPMLALTLLPLATDGPGTHGTAWLDLWLFALILLVAAWAGAAQLGLLLEMLSARWDAAHDPMTGIANRRSVLQRLDAAIARSRRNGSRLSLIVLDLDHFKQVNDRYGHACGDAVIIAAAAELERQLRDADEPGRLGGEEFVAVLPDTGLESALQVAERVRAGIEALAVDWQRWQVRFTVSIGVAERQPDESASDLLIRADQAMYAAKQHGRNRVEPATATRTRPRAP